MHGKIAKAPAAAGLALAPCGSLAACGPASSPGPDPQTSTTTPPAQNTSDVTITGSADTSSAIPVAGVTVAFKAATDFGSCATCGLHTAFTNAAGTYSIILPTGVYEALCAKTVQTCEVMTNPPVATARVTVDRNGSLNFLVAGTTSSPPPVPQPTDLQREAAATS
jgi:hypothetical protein